ncbi:HP0495 family protein [Carnimonas nigrificans]|uniref:HP0495 family protein n=1 Tax=Carnimonas nigrificans TaxID=64323 RepID=UPI0004B41B80
MKFPNSDKPVVMPDSAKVDASAQGQLPPKIDFPTDYPIKIVGDASDDFKVQMLAVVEQFAPGVDPRTVSAQDSRNGRFRSLRVTIRATSEQQLKELFAALKATGHVHMVI